MANSKTGLFMCDVLGPEIADSIRLNPEHEANNGKGLQVGVITPGKDRQFYLDTKGQKVPLNGAQLKELTNYIETLLK